MARILLLMATRTYRSRAFLRAAAKLGAQVVVGSERRQALARAKPGTTLLVEFATPERAVQQIIAAAQEQPFDAIVGVDDDSTLVAALASDQLGIPHNAPAAVLATRDKVMMRQLLRAHGVPSPWWIEARLDRDPQELAQSVSYPCVLKPTTLSASRGVIRADTPAAFGTAWARIAAILGWTAGDRPVPPILIEGFIPGREVALEGMMLDGALHTLAIFDKPDPLDGPFFEETLYITPSRFPTATQHAISNAARDAAHALGLTSGPVHAELRVNDEGVWIVEIAARTIGGLCSNVLEFGGGHSLEALVLLHATGADVSHYQRTPQPAGVLMLPIPRAGVLRAVHGQEEARAMTGIIDLTISIPIGERVQPLPEGDRYLGFMFARGDSPTVVEATLRAAHATLTFEIAEETSAVAGNRAGNRTVGIDVSDAAPPGHGTGTIC